MSTLELQHYLINKISSIEDQKFLTAIQELIESADIVEKPYVLSDKQHNAITAAEENISKGNTIAHNEVMKRTKEWLKGK